MIVFFNDKGRQTAEKIAETLCDNIVSLHEMSTRWAEEKAVIFVGAMGICVRSIAPLLRDKHTDPAVVCVDSLGKQVVSVLSGHVGGANELTKRIAAILNATPVITTQSDIAGVWALDTLYNKYGWEISGSVNLNKQIAAFVNGEPTALFIDYDDEGTRFMRENLPENVTIINNLSEAYCTKDNKVSDTDNLSEASAKYKLLIAVTPNIIKEEDIKPCMLVHYIPKALTVGIGLAHQAQPAQRIINEVWQTIEQHGYHRKAVRQFATIDIKADEPVVKTLQEQGYPFSFFTSETLATQKVPNPSAVVANHVGTASVCEAAALLCSAQNLNESTSRNLDITTPRYNDITTPRYNDITTPRYNDISTSRHNNITKASSTLKQEDREPSLVIPKQKGKDWTLAACIASGHIESISQKQSHHEGCTEDNFNMCGAEKQESNGNWDKKGGHIEIVGAGPGDPELISVRGRRFLEEADLILYAGSLVPKALTECHKEGALVRSSADMNLEEQFLLMKEYYDKGGLVVRLHTGDPCIYGAIQEQMNFFDQYGMDYHITPGISSFLAAAAELRSQFTIPEKTQTIILTRGEGRTPMPEKEQLHLLARSQSTMCIFLSASIVEQVQEELLQCYPPETPVAACYHLTWKDQRIYRGQLKDLASIVRDNGLTLTTMIVVGEAIDNRSGFSKLYDKKFSHLFRK